MEKYKAYGFLKNYIVACVDFLTIKNYQKALPLLESSLEEYKQISGDQNTGKMLANEYCNILYRTAWTLEQINENEKAARYYLQVSILNPHYSGLTEEMEKVNDKIKSAVALNNTAPGIKLFTPELVAGNMVKKVNKDAGQLEVSGEVNDASGIAWVKVNGQDVTTLKQDGFFRLSLTGNPSELNIVVKNKKGLTENKSYRLQASEKSILGDSGIPPIPPDVKPAFHAVLIACSNYNSKGFPRLPSAIEEAKEYKKMLIANYGFKEENIREIYDGDRRQILAGLDAKLKTLGDNDNLVILFAGHGSYSKEGSDLTGYWIPVNADELDYISNNDIGRIVANCQAKHILLMSDACYSAAMRSGNENFSALPELEARMEYKLHSRQVLTSGGFEKVPSESVFIKMVLTILKESDAPFLSAKSLYAAIFRGVQNQTKNEPELNTFGANDQGGQFYFIRSK